MHFAKKHNKKGFQKMQANNAKVMNACTKAIKAFVKPKEVKLKITPKVVNYKLTRLAYIAHPKLGKHICDCIANCCRSCQPKAQAPAKAQSPASDPAKAQAPVSAPARSQSSASAPV
ncbi:60S ribosomal protein L29-like [Octodon degus]|uniref:60S ribosomal protein L29-like n=1 Tax=Octodon degus TaxID=10160 RepID=A0A6P3FHL5_OCTDE|nr:60S ribosomal protein L29-like [Octodon degus]